MINATIGQVTVAGQDHWFLERTADGKEARVMVDPSVPVGLLTLGGPELLVVGKRITVNALRQPDGSLLARSLSIESDGVPPP